MKMRFPLVLVRLIKLLGEKLQQSLDRKSTILATPISPGHSSAQILESHSPQSNYSTLAILPLSSDIPVSAFTMELIYALQHKDPVIRLTKEYVENELGADAFEKCFDYKLSEWLARQVRLIAYM